MNKLQRYLASDCRPIAMQVHEVQLLSYTLGRWRLHLAQQPVRPAITQRIEAIDALYRRLHETLPPRPVD